MIPHDQRDTQAVQPVPQPQDDLAEEIIVEAMTDEECIAYLATVPGTDTVGSSL